MKKTALLAAVLVALALFMALPAFPGPIPASIVPESARWIAHLDMQKFVTTKLFAALEKSGSFDIKTRDAGRWLKVDPAKDISGVTLIGFESEAKDEPVLVVSGTFDKSRLLSLIELEEKHTETAYGAYTVYSSGGDGYGAFVNDNLIVLSESQAALQRVLDTAGGKSKSFAGSTLAASLKEVPSGAFLSGALPDLAGLSRMNSQSKVLEQASGLFFVAQERADNLFLRLQVTATTPENAKNMLDVVQGIIAMGRIGGNEGNMARIASLLDGLKVQQDGKVVRLEFERPAQEIADLLNHGRGLQGILD